MVAAALVVVVCVGMTQRAPATELSEAAALRLAVGAFENTPPALRAGRKMQLSSTGVVAQDAIAKSTTRMVDDVFDRARSAALLPTRPAARNSDAGTAAARVKVVAKAASQARLAVKHAVEMPQAPSPLNRSRAPPCPHRCCHALHA